MHRFYLLVFLKQRSGKTGEKPHIDSILKFFSEKHSSFAI